MTKEQLLLKLSYFPESGTFRWKTTTRRGFVGKFAGHVNRRGYTSIRIGGNPYLAHHLVWLAETGTWPSKHIDHINRNPADNRFCNLRECTHTENMRNTARHENRVGYSFDRTHGKWKVYLDQPDKKRINLGTVKTKEEAIELLERGKALCKAGNIPLWKPPSTPHLVFSFPC